jgi:hypothetical protein
LFGDDQVSRLGFAWYIDRRASCRTLDDVSGLRTDPHGCHCSHWVVEASCDSAARADELLEISFSRDADVQLALMDGLYSRP